MKQSLTHSIDQRPPQPSGRAAPLGWRLRWHNRVLDWIYRRSLVYSACWEDPAVDREALDIRSGDVLSFDRQRAAALHRLDRVGTYGGFHIADEKQAS